MTRIITQTITFTIIVSPPRDEQRITRLYRDIRAVAPLNAHIDYSVTLREKLGGFLSGDEDSQPKGEGSDGQDDPTAAPDITP